MELIFIGTKGNIEESSKKHKMHTSLLINYHKTRLLVDCGLSWLNKFEDYNPSHILLTHAHPDHVFGLREGAPCKVWATKITWDLISNFPIEPALKNIIKIERKAKIGSIFVEAFALLHSVNAPAVGYKIKCGKIYFFYAPDVAWIENRKKALKGVKFYIGDGATLKRSMIRKNKQTGEIFGHASVFQQLGWCVRKNVPEMIITHCGSQIVKREKKAQKIIEQWSKDKGIKTYIATDGYKIIL